MRKLMDGRCWVMEHPGTPNFNRIGRQRGTKPHGRRGFAEATLHFGGEVSLRLMRGKGVETETADTNPQAIYPVSEVRPKVTRRAGER